MADRRVNARTLHTKTAVALEFARHGSGYVLVGAVVGAVLLRKRRGPRAGAGDLAAMAAVAGLQPLVEWALHRFVLHQPGRTVAGVRIDPGAMHRGHHRVPDDVAGALLGPGFAVADTAGVAAVAAIVGRAVGGPAATFTGVAAGEAGLLAYEWTHLLCHSGYKPRTVWFRALRASHLRHHFRDETTNYGITSRLGDRVFGTLAA
jgi:hypothetical protein